MPDIRLNNRTAAKAPGALFMRDNISKNAKPDLHMQAGWRFF